MGVIPSAALMKALGKSCVERYLSRRSAIAQGVQYSSRVKVLEAKVQVQIHLQPQKLPG